MQFQLISREKIKAAGYRLRFASGEENIEDLAHSIEVNGLICPLAVAKRRKAYRLIAGERRLAALDALGWKEIPCVVLNVKGDVNDLVTGMAENMDRVDLSPWERALGLEELVTVYGLPEEEVGRRLNRSRTYVSHYRRLLRKVHPEILKYLHEGKIMFGHAQVLMRLDDQEKQLEIAEMAIKDGLTVKQTAIEVDLARPEEELTDLEKELNDVERAIVSEFVDDWRVIVDILQGKKLETVLLKFGSREELEELVDRIKKALSKKP